MSEEHGRGSSFESKPKIIKVIEEKLDLAAIKLADENPDQLIGGSNVDPATVLSPVELAAHDAYHWNTKKSGPDYSQLASPPEGTVTVHDDGPASESERRQELARQIVDALAKAEWDRAQHRITSFFVGTDYPSAMDAYKELSFYIDQGTNGLIDPDLFVEDIYHLETVASINGVLEFINCEIFVSNNEGGQSVQVIGIKVL